MRAVAETTQTDRVHNPDDRTARARGRQWPRRRARTSWRAGHGGCAWTRRSGRPTGTCRAARTSRLRRSDRPAGASRAFAGLGVLSRDGVAPQTVVLGPLMTLAYENEIYDLQNGAPADNYDPATSVFTAPVTGVYRFVATANGTSTTGSLFLRLLLSTDAVARLCPSR